MAEQRRNSSESGPPPRGSLPSALLSRREGDPERNRLIGEECSYEKLTKVPLWFYKESVTVGFWPEEGKLVPVRVTKAAFLWLCNLGCFFAHSAFAIASVVASTSKDGTMATPLMTLYTTDLEWVADTTNALLPKFKQMGGLHLAWLVLWFFLLSALAHLTIVVCNFKQAFARNDGWCCGTIRSASVDEEKRTFVNEEKRTIGWLSGWYFVNIHECRQPLRWLEYSISASIMAIVFSVAGGLSHVYFVAMIFSLMFTTNVFGWVSEVYNRPISRGGDAKPVEWQINDSTPSLLTFTFLPARLQRLWPYFLGWVPYATVWAPLLHTFFYNLNRAPEGAGPPEFVYVIVVSQCVLFTLFGFNQFWLLWRNDGPSVFYAAEVRYQVLSLVAKGFLGAMLVANVLIYQSFDDASNRARFAGLVPPPSPPSQPSPSY